MIKITPCTVDFFSPAPPRHLGRGGLRKFCSWLLSVNDFINHGHTPHTTHNTQHTTANCMTSWQRNTNLCTNEGRAKTPSGRTNKIAVVGQSSVFSHFSVVWITFRVSSAARLLGVHKEASWRHRNHGFTLVGWASKVIVIHRHLCVLWGIEFYRACWPSDAEKLQKHYAPTTIKSPLNPHRDTTENAGIFCNRLRLLFFFFCMMYI